MNVSEQIADIRERLMRVETVLDSLQKSVAAAPKGSIVIPVTLVTAIIQGGIAALQHFA